MRTNLRVSDNPAKAAKAGLLVLSRKYGEGVVITTPEGRRILVHVVGVQGGRVRLGFEADAEVKVWRSEIQKDIDEGKGK